MLSKFLVFAFCLVALGSVAQTKLIAHKSHSGSVESFRFAYENNFVELGNSNFGAAPQETIRTAALDSLIFISDSVTVMVTSNFCERRRSGSSKLWNAGRDTVRNHPLFSKKHSLDSIKTILQQQYYFKNPVEKIKFIGYDNKKDSAGCQDIRYVHQPSFENNHHQPSDNSSYLLIGIGLFSIASGTFSWLISKNKS